MRRITGASHTRRIVFGNTATPITPADRAGTADGRLAPVADPTHTHRWTVFVRPYGAGEDLSAFVRRVVFKLHDSFAEPSRSGSAPGCSAFQPPPHPPPPA